MDMNTKPDFWINKKAKIEILKDGQRLIFTATILEFDISQITFRDRDGIVFSFNKNLVAQIKDLGGGF